MSIAVNIVAGNFGYGNPASLGEPLGLWSGEADVTGDASGGFVQVSFQPQNPTLTPTLIDQRREFCYFIDGAGIQSSVDPGNMSVHVFMHMARSNAALDIRPFHAISFPALANGQQFNPSGDLLTEAIKRMPIFWDTQELASTAQIANSIMFLQLENNVNLAVSRFRAYGRYYDRQVVTNRSFGRLISPPPVAP